MKVYNGLEEVYHIKNPILTLGTFDGVHLGHQKIIQNIVEKAKEINGETVLFTFDPHPRTVLFPEFHNLKLIQTQEEKLAKLKRCGIEHVIVYPFSKDFSRTPATEFVRDYLVSKINVHTIVIGYDHQFGKNREGSLEHLMELSTVYAFDVIEIPAQEVDEVNVSSTKIRNALEKGDVYAANTFLGEPFQLNGIVVKGQGIGKSIGFPTANLAVQNSLKMIPKNGVYAIRVCVNNVVLFGMMNIGIRPTVSEDAQQTIEIHIFDFNDDLYNQSLMVEVIQFLREEHRFNSVDELITQLKKDEIVARTLLESVSSKLYAL